MRSKKAIYSIITNCVLQLIVLIYGFIIPKIIINKFGSAVNGLTASITQFLAYIALLESGFGPVVKSVLYKPIAKKDKNEISRILKSSERFFRVIALIFLGYIIALACVYPAVINNEFGYLYTMSLIVIISISTFVEYYFGMTYMLYLQAEQKNYIISIIKTITYVLNIIIVLALVKANASIHIIKAVTGALFVLRPIIQNLYVKRKYNINLKNVNGDYEIKQKWDGLAQHIAYVIHTNTDITLLTLFCNLTEVSVYSVYTMVMTGIKNIIQIFSNGIDSAFGDMIANKERKNLNNKFNMYEVTYFTITTIICVCTLILIVPFVQVYTNGIADTNYIRYEFGYLLVIGEFIWLIRLPYTKLIQAAGHFKQTSIGAWFEAITNIVISIALIFKYGIIGVAVGTAIAMLIRTIEFIYHSNKFILKRNNLISLKKIVLICIETGVVVLISNFIPMLNNCSYINWIINGIVIFIISCIIIFTSNWFFYKNEFKNLISILKTLIKRA